MTDNQREIIDALSKEISNALVSLEHNRNDSNDYIDKIEANIASYRTRAQLLRFIRLQLENEFTVIHYDPR